MKQIKTIILSLLVVVCITGCGCTKKEVKKVEEKPKYAKDASVVKDQIFTGLEFVNVGLNGGEITTSIINNTGVVYEPSTFTITIKDKNNEIIVEEKAAIEEPILNGDTKTVVTYTSADLTNAYSIEYSCDS